MATVSHSTTPKPEPNTPVPAKQTQTLLPARIQQDLRELFSKAAPDAQSLEKILELTARYTRSPFVAYYQINQEKLTPIALHGKLEGKSKQFGLSDIESICRSSAMRGQVTTRCVSQEHKIYVIAVPMAANERTPTVLTALVAPGKGGLGIQIATVERMAAAIVQWRLTDALTRLDWEAHTSSAATELVSKIESSESVLDSTFRLVNDLRDFLECKQVAVSFPRPTGVGSHVQAISGMAEFDRSSATVEHLAAAMDECMIRGDSVSYTHLTLPTICSV